MNIQMDGGNNMKSKGLGDTIEKITDITGIKKVVNFLFGEDCGCEERKNKLNILFPYTKNECLTEKEFNYLKIFDLNADKIEPNDQAELLKIYNRVFGLKQQPTSCTVCWVKIIGELKKLYKEYISYNLY